jgi:hypothetical protein
MKRDLLLSIFLVSSLSIFIACSSETSEDTKTEDKQLTLQENPPAEDEGFDFFLPSSMQIAHILKKSGVLYVDGLTNDPTKYSQYQTRSKRLLNLGVYTGDLAYCVLNSQTEMGLKYVAALKSLGNDLDLAEVYHSAEALDKIESTMENQDSLISFIINTQEKLNDYAHTNHQLSLLLETFTGAWIETMYIGANAENKHPEFISKRLAEQLGILENLIMGLEMTESNNDELDSIIVQLKEFKSTMPEYSDDFNNNLSEEEFEILKQKITSIRNNITNS